MIGADDAALVARDPEFAGLALLLDPERVRARLAADLPGTSLGELRAHYLRYKPGTSCLVAYRVEVAGAELDLHAMAWRSESAMRLDKAAGRRLVAGPLGRGLFSWDDLSTAIWVFPNDLEVRTLRRLGSPAERESLLETLAPERAGSDWVSVEPLAYKPGRRFAAVLVAADGERAVLKLYSRAAFAARAEAETKLGSGPDLRLPILRGRSERRRAVMLDWIPGELLGEQLRGETFPGAALDAAGAALARLHAQAAGELPPRDRRAGGEGLVALAETLGRLVPERAASVAATARELAAALARPSSGESDVPVHGDLHAKQVVVGTDRVGLLDLDRAARSSRAEDLGNLFAHLERDETLGRLAAGRAREASAALIEGYRRAGGVVPDEVELDRERAAALLRLAMHPFRNREPEWRGRVEALLDRLDAAAARAAREGRR